MAEKSPGTRTNDLTTKVDYHRLLWQELNKNFGDASSIFVMAVGQLSSSDYSITDILAAFRTFLLVDSVISCATYYKPTGSLISRMWERLIYEKGQTAGPEHLPAFEKAKYVLYADYGMHQITELYQDYLDKEIALKQKELQMEEECQEQYGDQWQRIFNGRLLRSKEYMEFQLADKIVHPHLDAIEVWEHGPLVHELNQMKQVLKENARSVPDYSGMSKNYYHVSLQPANWYQWFDPSQHPEGSWIQINVDSKNDDDDQAALYEKLGGSITKYHSLNKQSDVKISFKVRSVQINRPWLDLSILESRNFIIPGEPPGSWSTGELSADNKGSFPLLTTQMIVAKDITVTTSTKMEQKAIDDACSLFDVRIQSDSFMTINNNSIELKGTKVIGYVCTVVPKFPKQPISIEIPQNAHEIPENRKVLNKILDNLVQKKELTGWPPRQIDSFTEILMRYRDMTSVEDDVIANCHKEGTLAIDKLMSSKNKKHYLRNIKEIFVSKDITAFNCIIVEGAPGIGKSMLVKDIELSWVRGEILHQYKALISIPFNKIQKTLSVAELFKNMTSEYLNSEEIVICHEYFTNNSENQLCILIDGLDDDSVINSFITNLICGQVLPNALVIIFSQPTCTLKLPLVEEKVKRIEIIGFNKAMRKDFILKSLGSLHMKELVKYLKIHPMVNEICYKPFYLAIVVYLFEQGDLPKTTTKMYKLLILHTIYRHMKKYNSTSLDMDFDEIQDIPNKQLCTVVEKLSTLAFKAIKNDKNLFAMDEIISECPNINDVVGTVKGFGLLHAMECYIQQEDAKSIKFGFCHHSMQEYLAAYHISHLSPEKQLSEMNATFWNFWNGQFKYMWIMFAGITGITSATIFGKFLNPSQNKTWSEDLSQLELPEEIGEDKEKCSYLNQYFEEAEIVKKPNKVLEHYMEYILNQAKQENITVHVRHTKVMICGASGAGKTCLTCLLKHTTIPEEYKSTDVGESMQIFVVNKKEKQKDENITWTELDEGKEIDKITNRLLTYIMKKKMVEEDESDDSEDESDDLMNESSSSFDNNMKSNQNDDKGNKISQPIQTDSDTFKSTNSTFEDTLHVDSVDNKIAASAAVKSNKSTDSVNSEVEEETWDVLTLLDTGGQPEFINLLPAICRSTTVTFVVLNMLDGIKKKLEAKHSDERYEKYTLNYNNEHLTKSLLSVIKESSESKMAYLKKYRVNDPPKSSEPGVCFAGTHCDEISDRNRLNLIFEGMCEVVDAISDEQKVGKLDILNYEGHIIIKINNTLAGKQEMENSNSIANKLRQFVNKHQKFQPVYEIPITWLILELELRKQNKVCLKYEDVKKISERIFHGIELSDDELKIALQFFHDFGVLLYFNKLKKFNDYVVKDMNWLFKILTTIASEEIFKGTCTTSTCADSDSKSFRNGFFKERLLDALDAAQLNINDIDDNIDKILFLKLLEHLKIAASMPDEDNSGEFKYFMPCILKTCPWERHNETEILDARFGKQIVKEDKKEEKVNPLLIEFTSCPIPRGLFCFLVVSLIQFKENNWKFEPYLNLRGSQEGYHHPFANLILLKVTNKASYDGHFSLSLHDRILYLELQIRIQSKKPRSIYHDIKKIVYVRLSEICKQFGWKYDDLKCGFPCICDEQPHIVLSSDSNVWECKEQNEYHPTISDLIWLKDISDDLTSDFDVKRKCEESSDTKSYNVDYHRLLWQELNKEFGTATTIFVMKVGTPIPSYEYTIKYGHSDLADYNTFELVDPTMACATNYSQKSYISSMWKRLAENQEKVKQLLEENARSVKKDPDSEHCLNYYYVSMKPAEWYQWFDPQHLETGYQMWKRINVDSKNDDDDQAALYEKLGGAVTKYHSLNKHSDVKISFKVRAVEIKRPWLDLSILENTNYTIDGEKPQNWSTGELNADNKGWFPLCSTQMIVAKDITVTASTEMEQNAINDACSLFSVGSDSYKTINNNSIELKGTQVIGYVCTVVPKFPH